MGRENLMDVELGDIQKPVIDILFADIRNFTKLSEESMLFVWIIFLFDLCLPESFPHIYILLFDKI